MNEMLRQLIKRAPHLRRLPEDEALETLVKCAEDRLQTSREVGNHA